MITQVKFLGVCVSDQARALQFYTEKLGFTIRTDAPMGDQRWLNSPSRERKPALFCSRQKGRRIASAPSSTHRLPVTMWT